MSVVPSSPAQSGGGHPVAYAGSSKIGLAVPAAASKTGNPERNNSDRSNSISLKRGASASGGVQNLHAPKKKKKKRKKKHKQNHTEKVEEAEMEQASVHESDDLSNLFSGVGGSWGDEKHPEAAGEGEQFRNSPSSKCRLHVMRVELEKQAEMDAIPLEGPEADLQKWHDEFVALIDLLDENQVDLHESTSNLPTANSCSKDKSQWKVLPHMKFSVPLKVVEEYKKRMQTISPVSSSKASASRNLQAKRSAYGKFLTWRLATGHTSYAQSKGRASYWAVLEGIELSEITDYAQFISASYDKAASARQFMMSLSGLMTDLLKAIRHKLPKEADVLIKRLNLVHVQEHTAACAATFKKKAAAQQQKGKHKENLVKLGRWLTDQEINMTIDRATEIVQDFNRRFMQYSPQEHHYISPSTGEKTHYPHIYPYFLSAASYACWLMALTVRMIFVGHSQRSQVMAQARLHDFKLEPVACLQPTDDNEDPFAGVEKRTRVAPVCLDVLQIKSTWMYMAATNLWNDAFYSEEDHPMVQGLIAVEDAASNLPEGQTKYHLACLHALLRTAAGKAKSGRLLCAHHRKMFAQLELHKAKDFPQPAQQLHFNPQHPSISDLYITLHTGGETEHLENGGASPFAVEVEELQFGNRAGVGTKVAHGAMNRMLAAFFKAPGKATVMQRSLYMRGKDVNPEGKVTNMQDLRHNLITSKYLAWFNNVQFQDMTYEQWREYVCGHMNTSPEQLETTYISVPIIKMKKHLLEQQTAHYGGDEDIDSGATCSEAESD